VPHVKVQSLSMHPGMRASMTECFFSHDQLRGSSGLVDGRGSKVESDAFCWADEDDERPDSFSTGALSGSWSMAGSFCILVGKMGLVLVVQCQECVVYN